MRRFILIDACVAAAHFAPRTTRSRKLLDRATNLLTGTSAEFDPQFLIPNFCIGETFAVFEKYRWGASWNPQVRRASRLTPRRFLEARTRFHDAIHNGSKLLQVDLDRYHVLCLDLIAPINAAYRIKRDRGRKKSVSPASTYDLLLIAMSIWLQKHLGPEAFVLATADERVALIAKRAKSGKLGSPMKAHLTDVAQGLGLTYGPAIYPTVVDLIHHNKGQLSAALPGWQPAW